MDDQVEQAVEIGRENADLISLGKAWCTHIRTDRSEWGVGLVEEMTGLPITGGRFSCDFARQPTEFSGMQLAASALGFYEDNCKGCPNRESGGRVPNLSTWAEPQLAERDEQEQVYQAAQQAELAERQNRADLRALVAASLPASSQQIVTLINRIDLDPSDTDAHDSIRNHARLTPDAFAADVKDMLYTDARLLHCAVLLDVLLEVDTPGGAQMHGLCLNAAREGWGRAEGCRYLSKHGLQGDFDEDLLDAIISHAAPADWLIFGTKTTGEPAALLHYHSLEPNTVEQRVRTLLGHGQAWRRAGAAAAAEALVEADPACGERLLTALLDGLRHEERIDDRDRASGDIASVVAVILRRAPQVVDAAVEGRWSRASSAYRSRLTACYYAACSYGSEQLDANVGRIVIARAVKALSEPLDRGSDRIGDDYQIVASELLASAVRASPTEALQRDVLIALLLDWLARERNLTEAELSAFEPATPFLALEKMSAQVTTGRIVLNVANAVVALGRREPSAFISVCSDVYAGTEAASSVRARVVRLAGRVAAKSSAINEALPLVYTAMLGDDQSVRAAGMEAAEAVMRAIPSASIPPLLAEAAVAGLTDQFLIVVWAAVKAAREVPADLVDHRDATVKLLNVARAYASERLRDQMVQDALAAVYRLARDDEPWLDRTRAAALDIVKLVPAYNARQALRRHQWLELHDNWADAAIHALRPDDDPQYEHLGDSDKEWLLANLGRSRLAAHQIDALAVGEREAGKHSWRRSLLFAELFSELGRPGLAAEVIESHLVSVPDTIEKQHQRRSMELMLHVYGFEEAVASRQHGARNEILDRVEERRGTMRPRMSGVALPDPVEVIRARNALVDALEAVAGGGRDAGLLESALDGFRSASGSLSEGDVVWVLGELVEALAHAVRWADAVWSAEQDAARHATAAGLRASRASSTAGDLWPSALREAAAQLEALEDHEVPAQIAARLAAIPLPPRLTDLYRPSEGRRAFMAEPAQDNVPVAAILIRLHGEPVMRPTVVHPGALHHFEMEARVSGWPEGADALEITFLSVHPRDVLYASDVRFTTDEMIQPLEIRVAGERPSGDPPLKLTAHAAFVVNGEPSSVDLAGNTTLEIVTFDPGTAAPLNIPTAARQLQKMMGALNNALPNLDATVRRDARFLLEALARFAHTFLDDRLALQDDVNEAWFQQELRYFLQADHRIGARLEERAGRAGGETDLLLGDVVLELKVEKKSPISLDTACSRYAGQATQYASAGDCQVALLAVLDVSSKRAPAGVMGNEMDWAYPETTSGQNPPFPSLVGVVVIRGGFPRPSDLSR